MIEQKFPGKLLTDTIGLGGGILSSVEDELLFGSIGQEEKGRITHYQVDNQGNRVNSLTLDSSGNLSLMIGQFHSGSDRRLKKYIRPLGSSLDLVLNLNPVTFQWRAPHENTSRSNSSYGFIGDEVQEVFPNIVKDGGVTSDSLPDNVLQVAYIELIPILTKCIQELAERVKALEGG